MAKKREIDVRGQILELLMDKVAEDKYPSSTMMDMIERMMGPDEVPLYATILMDKIRADRYPSVPMMRRLLQLG